MPTYKIRGIDVDFPYEAYDSQLVYMDKVMQSLQEESNALLESPTGTGKTLCLLCATLAWRKSLGSFSTGMSIKTGDNGKTEVSSSQSEPGASKFPTIVYASRTHSQIRQVIQELKRTSYRPKMTVLGSREQFCIHDEVKLLRGRTQTNACRFACRRRAKQKRRCNHFNQVLDYLKQNPNLGEEPVDIEDLVNIGKTSGPCPYHLAKELHKAVDIIFAPYNYLIDRGKRKALQISWSNSILIFDEAHNLESICADAASFDLPSWLLTACISEAQSCVDLLIERRNKSNDKSQNPDDFAILKALLLKLEKRIAEVHIESKELGFTKPGPYIFELLADLNITHKTAPKLKSIVTDASTLLEEDSQEKSTSNICRLETMKDILDIIFRDGRTSHAKYYRVHVKEAEAWAANGSLGKVSRTLSWWCFNPGIALEEFAKDGVRSIILTSGTLSPLDSFAEELKLDFPIRLENPHVIGPNQIWAGVVPVGPLGRTFNSSYRTRDTMEYKQELGNAIVNLTRIVPDGLLVFFPSYYLLEQSIGCWKSLSNDGSSIWERICKNKKPVIEPRESSMFTSSIKDYLTKLNDTTASGAVFFAVCRGKVSEGLDFADHAGRAVVVTGLPYATVTDPKVRLKREYLDQQSGAQGGSFKVLTGDEWYNQQASRAVNQAVGRVIRHRHDYGAIIFCDERFTQPHRQSQVSKWIQPHIKCYSRFGEVVFTLTRFFRDGRTRGAAKLSLLEAENGGNLGEIPSSEHSMEKFHMEKLLSPLPTPVDPNCTLKASSLLDTKKGHTSFMRGVLPANRSSLSSDHRMFVGSESSSDTREVVLHKRRTVLSQEHDGFDLADSCQLGEKSKNMLIAPCITKKRRFIAGEYDLKQHFGNSNEQSSSASQNAQGDVDPQCKDNVTSQSRNLEFLRQKDNLPADSTPTSDGTQGSAFLAQVRDKLSAAEYIDFVGYMKALKTKTLKISEVLLSISRLFSGPERLPLLKRFKDYIPAKYHSLYEQYVEGKVD
ncbi:regulator of telomere elongation helicase 1 homolog [Medicago truncatula]|uniref:Regulator of telomere elongation helicase 1 homolog n=1 Tax=Medicago truncatula TaxID=3880 RepID=G7II45_MEDTR|nr:regulator of telomere elongation helicase 1 homolog [Medicago truncatula]XP_024632978.1 regulator of telomere elongation helicase 1 homolog [Medicago truncatula]XP_024632979.1 regulator of telomere elongation helicase 1 homolog [Medicago truncatula]XP_024632980.1 regulator of telomere elongation helicase 1 homolog [Medicago truncatula]XP_039686846.1 regulator of telomere elongation helicase 1 homolog [Medicago truncatula]AES68026.2 regulator of telomere elongation helicase-like protein [Med